jgi:hypothetical protein
MTDIINEKVINIFTRHKKQLPIADDEKVIRSEDGFYYVCIKKDENGIPFDKDRLLNSASELQYIVKVMVTYQGHPHIYMYKVPSERLLEFLSPYMNKKKEGEIIEVEKYYPHELA